MIFPATRTSFTQFMKEKNDKETIAGIRVGAYRGMNLAVSTNMLSRGVSSFLSVIIVIFLFTLGRFALFDLLGIRRAMQFTLLAPMVMLGIPLFISNLHAILKNAQLWFLIFLCSMMLLNGQEFLIWFDILLSIFIIGLLMKSSPGFYERVLTILIKTVFFFSLLSFVQFWILLIYPSLNETLIISNDAYLSTSMLFNHPFQLLGLNVGDQYLIAGLRIGRVNSFLYEPSLFVSFFLLPATLALTFDDNRRKMGIGILIFTLFSLTGSVYAVFVLALLCWPLLHILKRNVSSFIPFVFAAIFMYLIFMFVPSIEVSVEEVQMLMGRRLEYLQVDTHEFWFSRMGSGIIRLSIIKGGIGEALNNFLLGTGKELGSVLGLFLYALVYSGIVGFIFCCVFAYKMFNKIVLVYKTSAGDKFRLISAVLLYSIFIQTTIFNDYGFTTTFGMSMLALTYRRLGALLSFKRV